MRKMRTKVITIVVVLIVLLLCAAFRLFDDSAGEVSPDIESTYELEGETLGGMVSKMPDASAKILFESILGVKLGSYQSFPTIEESIAALRSNEIQALWCADITADYLTKTEDGLHRIDTTDHFEPRLSFAMAVRNEKSELKDELNEAIIALKENGTLDKLITTYVEFEEKPEPFYEKDMTKEKTNNGTLYVGITGAVPPLDMVDYEQKPYGFSVAFMDEVGQLLQRKVKMVYLNNDTSFTMLMGGKVDVLFCYGTSKNTVGTKLNFVMTDGYYEMNQYAYLVVE